MAEIRAAFLQLELLAAGTLLGEEVADAMRRAAGADGAGILARAAPTDWLPLSLEIAMLREVEGLRGEAGVLAVARELGRRAKASAVLRPLASAKRGMLGSQREALLEFALSSWDLAMRNAGRRGEMRRSGAREVRVAHEEIPAGAWDWLVALRIRGSFEALLEEDGVRPEVEVIWEPGSTRALYIVRWP